MHLFFDILARNGAVAEAGLAQDTPAAFPQTRELASSQRQCNIDSALTLKEETTATEPNEIQSPSCSTCQVRGNSGAISSPTHSRTYIKHLLARARAAETRGGSSINGSGAWRTCRPFSPASSSTLSRPWRPSCRFGAITFVTRPERNPMPQTEIVSPKARGKSQFDLLQSRRRVSDVSFLRGPCMITCKDWTSNLILALNEPARYHDFASFPACSSHSASNLILYKPPEEWSQTRFSTTSESDLRRDKHQVRNSQSTCQMCRSALLTHTHHKHSSFGALSMTASAFLEVMESRIRALPGKRRRIA